MKLITDNEILMQYVPNSVKAVAGELSLYEKINTSIYEAERWVEQFFTGPQLLEDTSALDAGLLDALRSLVAAAALERAVPTLDVVLTPNGFGVVNTNTIAAASKPRIDRLLESLRDKKDAAVNEALRLLPLNNDWRETEQARYFGKTFFPNLELVALYGDTGVSRWLKYIELRSRVVGIEMSLAEEFFSPELMMELRLLNMLGTLTDEQLYVVNSIRSQVVDVLRGKPINGTRMRDTVNFIKQRPESFPIWHSSATAELFSPPVFRNEKSAKGYWF